MNSTKSRNNDSFKSGSLKDPNLDVWNYLENQKGLFRKKKKKKRETIERDKNQIITYQSSPSTDQEENEEVIVMNKFIDLDIHSNGVEIVPIQELHEEDPIVFAEFTPSANLICPIHKGLFISPVVAKCGHTFCKPCLVLHVENGIRQMNECPLDKTVIKKEDLYTVIPNLVVVESISSAQIYCKYGCKKENGIWKRDDEGCPKIINLGKRKQHEEKCAYAKMKCPYNEGCPLIRRMDLEQHLKTCTHVPCPHKKYGCKFEAGASSLEEHLQTCPFEAIKGFIEMNQKKIIKMKRKMREKDEASKLLNGAIAQLNTKLDYLVESFENRTARFEGTIRQLTTSLEGTQTQLVKAKQEIEALKQSNRKNNPDNIEIPIENYQPVSLKGTFTGHKGPVWGLAVTNDGFLVSGSSDTTIKIWDVGNLKTKQTLTGHEGIVHAVVVYGNKLCSGSSDRSLRIWDLESMKCIKVIRTHDYTICSLCCVDGILFSGSYMEIRVWNLETYECAQTLTGHNHWVRALTTCEDFLYSGSYNIIKIWDLKNTPYQCIRTITGNYGSIYCLAVAKEQRRLFSGTYEKTINVYDLDTYQSIESLDGHIGAVYTLAVSPSGHRFYSGSYDSTIKVWNTQTLKCLQTLVRHSSSVDALVAAGGCIFSGGADHSVKVWK